MSYNNKKSINKLIYLYFILNVYIWDYSAHPEVFMIKSLDMLGLNFRIRLSVLNFKQLHLTLKIINFGDLK